MSKQTVAENSAYLALGLTICGQIFVGWSYLLGMSCYLAANLIFVTRNIVLQRPKADMMKDVALTAISISLVTLSLLGIAF
jgi:hypothetical protein